MTTWARANTAAAWYAEKYPGSRLNLSPETGVGVIHTTEGASLPGYEGGATAPNMTLVPNFEKRRLTPFAHFPDEMSSRALRNLAGGVETNTLNAWQIELVGTCAPGTHAEWTRRGIRHIFWPKAPTWALLEVARCMVDLNKRHGLALTGPDDKDWVPYPESYGSDGQRFTHARWRNFTGWCGHQHVPENLHGDPGDFPFGKVLELALAIKARRNPTRLPTPTPRWDAIYEGAAAIRKSAPAGSARDRDTKVIMELAAKHSSKH